MNLVSSAARHTKRNELLAALPAADYERLAGSLELVPLALGRAVYGSLEVESSATGATVFTARLPRSA